MRFSELKKQEESRTFIDNGLIGPSDFAKIIGCHPIESASAFSVWDRVVNGSTFTGNNLTRWGHWFESRVFFNFCEEQDSEGAENWEPGVSHRFDDKPWLRMTPDYIDPVRRWLMEIKTTGHGMKRHWFDDFGNPILPDFVRCQVQPYMHLLDLEVCFVPVLWRESSMPQEHRVENYDREFSELILEEVERFYTDYILTKKPPPADGSDACRDYLSRTKPKGKTVVELEWADHRFELCSELRDIDIESKRLATRKKELQNRILEELGDDYGFEGEFGRIVSPAGTPRKLVDWKKVRAELSSQIDRDIVDHIISNNTNETEPKRSIRGTWKNDKKAS